MSILVTSLVVLAVVLNVVGQVLLKWRIASKGDLVDPFLDKWGFLFDLLFDPYVILAFACVFGASILWLISLSKVELSWAYPFMGLSFVMILAMSVWLFGETINLYKVIGVLMIFGGVVVSYLSK